MHHHINWHAGDLVTSTPRDFENHLAILRDKKVQTIFLDELVQYLTGVKRVCQPAVAMLYEPVAEAESIKKMKGEEHIEHMTGQAGREAYSYFAILEVS